MFVVQNKFDKQIIVNLKFFNFSNLIIFTKFDYLIVNDYLNISFQLNEIKLSNFNRLMLKAKTRPLQQKKKAKKAKTSKRTFTKISPKESNLPNTALKGKKTSASK
jgi:hypothetical protein